MGETKTILVAGTTGQQGGAVARSLTKRGHRVVAFARDPAKAKALGYEALKGDLTDRKSIERALKGAQGFYVVTTPFLPDWNLDLEGEVRQGTMAVDAAKAVGVPHLVLSSVGSADANTGIPHFETKARVEKHLKASGQPYTIVRPTLFMETLTSGFVVPAIQAGAISLPIRPETRLTMVATRDIGEAVAMAFDNPREIQGRTIELAGDELTVAETIAKVSRWAGRPLKFVRMPDDQARKTYGDDLTRMFRWFDEVGYHADPAQLGKSLGLRLTRLDDYLQDNPYRG